MGHLLSRPCLCPGLVLEMQFSTPPRETVNNIVVIIIVVVFSLVKLRRGRLNYVGGEISPETDLRYTKIFETFCELQLFVFFVCEYSPEADLSYTRKMKTLQMFVIV